VTALKFGLPLSLSERKEMQLLIQGGFSFNLFVLFNRLNKFLIVF